MTAKNVFEKLWSSTWDSPWEQLWTRAREPRETTARSAMTAAVCERIDEQVWQVISSRTLVVSTCCLRRL